MINVSNIFKREQNQYTRNIIILFDNWIYISSIYSQDMLYLMPSNV